MLKEISTRWWLFWALGTLTAVLGVSWVMSKDDSAIPIGRIEFGKDRNSETVYEKRWGDDLIRELWLKEPPGNGSPKLDPTVYRISNLENLRHLVNTKQVGLGNYIEVKVKFCEYHKPSASKGFVTLTCDVDNMRIMITFKDGEEEAERAELAIISSFGPGLETVMIGRIGHIHTLNPKKEAGSTGKDHITLHMVVLGGMRETSLVPL